MRRFLRRIVILFLFYILGTFGTALLLNSETTDDRTDMNAPTLPILMIQLGDSLCNRMTGYKIVMESDFMRECVTPLDTSHALSFVVDPYGNTINSLSYEIRTSDGSKVIENRKVKNLEPYDTYQRASVTIDSSLRLNQEYSMQISLETDQGTVYYYTRIVQRAKVNAEQFIRFVKSFYEKCMDKNSADDIAAYLETDGSTGSMNFANITIHNALSEVSWGNLKPMLTMKGIPVIKDINETTASFQLEYQISARDAEGNVDIFNVTEFYRLMYAETRIQLLNFNRESSQVFAPRRDNITEEGLELGIRNKNVHYMLNRDVSTVAFVQEGELWTYSPDDGKMVRIFTFRRDENSDYRDTHVAHDIKIIRVSENGDVDFVLSGYMNRGIHEGYCGISVFHYNSDAHLVEEKVFIPVTESPEFLQMDLGNLSYVNPDNQLFLLFAHKLYRVDIDSGRFRILEEDIDPDAFASSDESTHAAWDLPDGSVKEINFDSGKISYRTPEAGRQYRVMGFLNEDLIYGIVYETDILTDENGHTSEGISFFRIEDFDGNLKKEYRQDGYYIMEPVTKGTMMEFMVMKKEGLGYTFYKKDNIMNNQRAAANQVAIELEYYSRMGIIVRLAFESVPETTSPLVIIARMRSTENHEAKLEARDRDEEAYYVYAKGRLDSIFSDPTRAIRRADEQLGVVLNRAQQYIWERGNRKVQYTLNLEDVPRIFRQGSTDIAVLQEGLLGEGKMLDLTGCTMDEIFYEISAQRAVIAKTGPSSSVVIIGYDRYNTWQYDPLTGETKPMSTDDSEVLFEKAGNVFLTFIETVTY